MHAPRLSHILEDSLSYFAKHFSDSYVPHELLEDLLYDSHKQSAAAQHAALQGNKLQAVQVADSVLVFSTSGQIGQLVCLTVLRRCANPDSSMHASGTSTQCHLGAVPAGSVSVGGSILSLDVKTSPVQQHDTSSSSATMSVAGQSILLCARCINKICLLRAVHVNGSWQLQLEAESPPQASPPAHIAWNPHLSELAYTCADGSLWLVDVADCCTSKQSTAQTLGQVASMQPRKLLDSVFGSQLQQADILSSLMCVYGHHPRQLIVASGNKLMRLRLKSPNATPGFEVITELTDRQQFTALATHYTSNCKPGSWLSGSRSASRYQLMVAATTTQIQLYDLRRPAVPLLYWEHGLTQQPPPLVMLVLLSDMHADGAATSSQWGNDVPVSSGGLSNALSHLPSQLADQLPSQLFQSDSQVYGGNASQLDVLSASQQLFGGLLAGTQASQMVDPLASWRSAPGWSNSSQLLHQHQQTTPHVGLSNTASSHSSTAVSGIIIISNPSSGQLNSLRFSLHPAAAAAAAPGVLPPGSLSMVGSQGAAAGQAGGTDGFLPEAPGAFGGWDLLLATQLTASALARYVGAPITATLKQYFTVQPAMGSQEQQHPADEGGQATQHDGSAPHGHEAAQPWQLVSTLQDLQAARAFSHALLDRDTAEHAWVSGQAADAVKAKAARQVLKLMQAAPDTAGVALVMMPQHRIGMTQGARPGGLDDSGQAKHGSGKAGGWDGVQALMLRTNFDGDLVVQALTQHKLLPARPGVGSAGASVASAISTGLLEAVNGSTDAAAPAVMITLQHNHVDAEPLEAAAEEPETMEPAHGTGAADDVYAGVEAWLEVETVLPPVVKRKVHTYVQKREERMSRVKMTCHFEFARQLLRGLQSNCSKHSQQWLQTSSTAVAAQASAEQGCHGDHPAAGSLHQEPQNALPALVRHRLWVYTPASDVTSPSAGQPYSTHPFSRSAASSVHQTDKNQSTPGLPPDVVNALLKECGMLQMPTTLYELKKTVDLQMLLQKPSGSSGYGGQQQKQRAKKTPAARMRQVAAAKHGKGKLSRQSGTQLKEATSDADADDQNAEGRSDDGVKRVVGGGMAGIPLPHDALDRKLTQLRGLGKQKQENGRGQNGVRAAGHSDKAARKKANLQYLKERQKQLRQQKQQQSGEAVERGTHQQAELAHGGQQQQEPQQVPSKSQRTGKRGRHPLTKQQHDPSGDVVTHGSDADTEDIQEHADKERISKRQKVPVELTTQAGFHSPTAAADVKLRTRAQHHNDTTELTSTEGMLSLAKENGSAQLAAAGLTQTPTVAQEAVPSTQQSEEQSTQQSPPRIKQKQHSLSKLKHTPDFTQQLKDPLHMLAAITLYNAAATAKAGSHRMSGSSSGDQSTRPGATAHDLTGLLDLLTSKQQKQQLSSQQGGINTGPDVPELHMHCLKLYCVDHPELHTQQQRQQQQQHLQEQHTDGRTGAVMQYDVAPYTLSAEQTPPAASSPASQTEQLVSVHNVQLQRGQQQPPRRHVPDSNTNTAGVVHVRAERRGSQQQQHPNDIASNSRHVAETAGPASLAAEGAGAGLQACSTGVLDAADTSTIGVVLYTPDLLTSALDVQPVTQPAQSAGSQPPGQGSAAGSKTLAQGLTTRAPPPHLAELMSATARDRWLQLADAWTLADSLPAPAPERLTTVRHQQPPAQRGEGKKQQLPPRPLSRGVAARSADTGRVLQHSMDGSSVFKVPAPVPSKRFAPPGEPPAPTSTASPATTSVNQSKASSNTLQPYPVARGSQSVPVAGRQTMVQPQTSQSQPDGPAVIPTNVAAASKHGSLLVQQEQAGVLQQQTQAGSSHQHQQKPQKRKRVSSKNIPGGFSEGF